MAKHVWSFYSIKHEMVNRQEYCIQAETIAHKHYEIDSVFIQIFYSLNLFSPDLFTYSILHIVFPENLSGATKRSYHMTLSLFFSGKR